MRQWHASATARFGCIAATSARAYVCGLPPPPPGPVAAAVAKCYRTWHAAVASRPSPLGPAVAEHKRMCRCGPPPAPLAPYSTSSLNAAAARRPVTRDTHMSDHALIIDDPHVSDESLMTHRQREVLPARGTWEWYGPAPLRPSSQLSPWLHRHPLSAGQRDVLGPLA